MISKRIARFAGWALAPLAVAGMVITQAGAASAGTTADGGHHHQILFVSPHAWPWGADRSCRSARFRTIQSAVNAIQPGGTVVVCPGTYHEQVVVTKPVSLVGQRATIDEAGVFPGLVVPLPKPIGSQRIWAGVVIVSSGVQFSGFTVEHAQGEGILAAGLGRDISGLSISHSAIVHNDLGFGFPKPKSTYFECAANGQIPGDCGEGIHFTGVAFSSITGNFVAFNSGGMLLSDDTGPTHGNLVARNVVTGNSTDCGITMPGHNPGALNAMGQREPSVAGVYDNVIRDNVVTNNGLKGEGAGVLFANASAGTAVYDNLVQGNFIAGNELAGVTFHAHTLTTGTEDLSGNRVIGNVIGQNNLGGDPLDSPASPKDLLTTGILVFSGGTTVTTTIAFNHISNNKIGIWLSKAVIASGLSSNSFANVATPILSGQ
jgi:Periplasmic copper-binding protein (NosD)